MRLVEVPEQRLRPDVRRLVRGNMGKREVVGESRFQLKSAGLFGYVWVDAQDISDVVRKRFVAFENELVWASLWPSDAPGIWRKGSI